jgi:ankyrin repeat protein
MYEYDIASRLYYAARDGDKDQVLGLLSLSIDPNTRWKGRAPLHRACYRGHLDVVKALLDRHADINAPCSTSLQYTPLHYACRYSRDQVIHELLGRRADVNASTTALRQTPLHLASERGLTTVVRTLIDARADMNAIDVRSGKQLARSQCR